ncbi:hypothetical protein BUALT_Bualt16G0041200 [Buddleja alternifolia]|uniref:Uncharacterized protein n=1 Tax=Buddleja alternifolia TaxID=168488 RepID=A0AAV6WJI7_9LAMI|nr:hypothetical protein BUALT_Bualt16G0041200 [Buddleja alternifolia]
MDQFAACGKRSVFLSMPEKGHFDLGSYCLDLPGVMRHLMEESNHVFQIVYWALWHGNPALADRQQIGILVLGRGFVFSATFSCLPPDPELAYYLRSDYFLRLRSTTNGI